MHFSGLSYAYLVAFCGSCCQNNKHFGNKTNLKDKRNLEKRNL